MPQVFSDAELRRRRNAPRPSPPSPPRTRADIIFDIKLGAIFFAISVGVVLATASREMGLWHWLTRAPFAEHITRTIPAAESRAWLLLIPRFLAAGGALMLIVTVCELLLTYRQRPRAG